MLSKKNVAVYTDGACSGNPGPGGWGAVLCYKGREKEISGGEALTTNNRMELTAVISALECLKEPCEVDLYSDSKYVIDALEKKWAESWRKKGWIKISGKSYFCLSLSTKCITIGSRVTPIMNTTTDVTLWQ